MSLRTPFTELFSIEHPIASAPMAGSAGGALAAAVSNGGGLGLIGGGYGDPAWLDRELGIVAERTGKPWGVGFLSWAVRQDVVERVLAHRPHAVMLSFGDPRPLAEPVKRAGVKLIIQVTDLDEARLAMDAGADVIIAQGSEAGGHGGGRATLPFVPVAVDIAAPIPVLAAGGIADGRGLAAALALGAAGALIGTRFLATSEALATAATVKAILDGAGEDTERGRVLDIGRGAAWPARYPGRALRNAFTDQWRGREDELERDEAAKSAYRAAVQRGDQDFVPVWASEAIDLITEVATAADLVGVIAAEAEAALARAGSTAGQTATTKSAPGTGSVTDHRLLAAQLFNHTWELIEREGRTRDDDDLMIHSAHASRYHWGQAPGVTAAHLARGEWQISRVYAILGRPEPALRHARRVLDLCAENGIADFDLAFGYEALARACAVAGDTRGAREHTDQALAVAKDITADDDRALLLADLETIPGQPRYW